MRLFRGRVLYMLNTRIGRLEHITPASLRKYLFPILEQSSSIPSGART